jgi:Uma2 family endonuclease
MTTLSQLRTSDRIPPLANGDRLTRDDFEWRYQVQPKLHKAELIEGIVYMSSPVRYESHGSPHANIMGWLWIYCAATPGVDLADNATVRLDLGNEPQPDALLRLAKGKSHIDEDDYVEGAPELVVEVAASSASYDLHSKLEVYRRNGVQEYLVWQVYDRKLTWFSLQNGEYVPLPPDDLGIIRSQIFPGLHLAVGYLLAGNRAMVMKKLQEGLATPEYEAFVKRLSEGTKS